MQVQMQMQPAASDDTHTQAQDAQAHAQLSHPVHQQQQQQQQHFGPLTPMSALSSMGQHMMSSGPGPDMMPFAPQREPSGLDALAEVSRQLQANGGVGSDEAFMAQLQQHIDESEDGRSVGDHQAQQPSLGSYTPSTTPPSAADMADIAGPHTVTMSAPASVSAPVPAATSAATTTANERLAEAAMQLSQSALPRSRKRKASSAAGPDPTLPNSYLSYHPQRPPPSVHPIVPHHSVVLPLQPRPDGDGTPQCAGPPSDDQSPAFAINQGGFGLLQRANKSKARGRFTEERRKEVQNVRKKGACLRCRMLKKPCSEGTPCGTCKNIESARLWKNACIRTRVADEFALYSTTYFYTKDRCKVYASLNGADPRTIRGRIEVTLFPNSGLYGTFPALKTNRAGEATDADDDLDAALVHAAAHDDQDHDSFLLSFKTEDTLALKLERYLHAATVQCIESESSRVMRETLTLAAQLSVSHADDLLTKFIHLWVATNILVEKGPLWTISYNPNDAPVTDNITVVDERKDDDDDDDDDDAAKPSERSQDDQRVHFSPHDPDYDIMHAQLQDAAERYCQKQAKACLNDLERRLLLRQQSSSFLTFLAAVICLNCVERMTALYHSFDVESATAENKDDSAHGTDTTPRSQDGQDLLPPSPSNLLSDWPLPDPPSVFWPQGPHFASLLQLLLRMRGLPPSIHINDDGSLAIVSNFNKAYPVFVRGDTEGGDSQQVLAAQWIEKTGLDAKELWRCAGLSDADAAREAWSVNADHVNETAMEDEKEGGEGESLPGVDEAREEPSPKQPEAKAVGARAWDLRYIALLLLPQAPT